MNSITFKVIRAGEYVFPFGWRGDRVWACELYRKALPWPGLYEVTLHASKKFGRLRISGVRADGVCLELWECDEWRYFNTLCVPVTKKLPINKPFWAETEWLREATRAELARWC